MARCGVARLLLAFIVFCMYCVLVLKVLIIQFYVFLFTDKLQRVAFLIFSRSLYTTILKSDYEYAFFNEYHKAKGKMQHNPFCIASQICVLEACVLLFFLLPFKYFYEHKRFTMQRKAYCSLTIFMRMHTAYLKKKARRMSEKKGHNSEQYMLQFFVAYRNKICS